MENTTTEYVRLSNENRELRHELLNLRKDYMAAVEQLQELQAKLTPTDDYEPNDYEPSVSPRDCAIGGEEDSNWT